MSGDISTSEPSEKEQTPVSNDPTVVPESASDPLQATSGEAAAVLDSVDRIQELERELQTLRQEHETLNGQYVRIAADFDNFRKRQSRDQDDMRQQLVCSTLTEILPVVDNFERARQQLNPEGDEAQALHRSYQGLYKQLVEVLKQQGVARMDVVGQEFDPNLHEAVLREESSEFAEDVVCEELQRGYHRDGRVLRHAMVKVSMGPGPSDPASAPAEATAAPDQTAEEA